MQGCGGFAHPCPPAGSTQPVTVDDGLKVIGSIDGDSSLTLDGSISIGGSFEGGFSTENFSTGYNECTIAANSIKKDCAASCSFGDTPIDCGYILQMPANQATPMMGVNVNALYADIIEGKCNAMISNSTATQQKVGIRAVCISE